MSLPYPIERQREAERKWRQRVEEAAARARQNAYRHAASRALGDCPNCGSPLPNGEAASQDGFGRWACACCGYTWPRAMPLAS